MKVIEAIKEHGLEYVIETYGLDTHETDKLICLNYNQINSPKFSLADECRGLILEKGTWNIVCRTFPRFYNFGEGDVRQEVITRDNASKLTVLEKLDGSLLKVYYYDGEWRFSSNATVEANFIFRRKSDDSKTFNQLVEDAIIEETEGKYKTIDAFMRAFNANPDETYLFELITPYNRVVVDYKGDIRLVFLCTVDKDTGRCNFTNGHGFLDVPKMYDFLSPESMVKEADEFGAEQEGYVVYYDGQPIAKVKSSLYVKLHYIRDNGLSAKNIIQIVLDNEQDEYLAYFPEDESFIQEGINLINALIRVCETTYERIKDLDNKTVGLMFKNKSIEEISGCQVMCGRYNMSFVFSLSSNSNKILSESVVHTICFLKKNGKVDSIRDAVYKFKDSPIMVKSIAETLDYYFNN